MIELNYNFSHNVPPLTPQPSSELITASTIAPNSPALDHDQVSLPGVLVIAAGTGLIYFALKKFRDHEKSDN